MADSFEENILVRKSTVYGEEPTPIAEFTDLDEDFEFEGIVRLKRILNTESKASGEDKLSGYEYVFEVISITKLQKEV